MADSSLSITDTSSSGGMQAFAAAACNVQRDGTDGTDDIEVDEGDYQETTLSTNIKLRCDKISERMLELEISQRLRQENQFLGPSDFIP